MSLQVDQKYALILPLDKFERKHHANYFANFRCPICGDSIINKNKKRAWFYINNDQISTHCFNCGYSSTLQSLIYDHFPQFYQDYIKEKYLTKYNNKYQKQQIEYNPFEVKYEELDLTSIKDLPNNHSVIKYAIKRKISLDKIYDCYYSDNFYDWCKKRQPDTFNNDYNIDRRIVFPFRDRVGKIFGVSGRSIDNKSPKYLTMKLTENDIKVFGYDKLDLHKPIYVTEGQIDSLFIDNCIGVIGALASIDRVCDYCKIKKDNITLVIDNEKRNKETCAFIKKNLDNGYKVCLWPQCIKEKDINEMIINGKTQLEIKTIINENTVQGLSGILKFNNWKKVR